MLFPLFFILRRTVFAINAIVFFEYPHIQMVTNLITSLFYTIFLLQSTLFDDKMLRNIEIFSEFTFYLICSVILQFQVVNDPQSKDALNITFYVALGLLFFGNICFIICTIRQNKLKNKRLLAMRKAWLEECK